MDLLEQFKAFVKANELLPDARPALLAVSGGVDSVVMAQLFRAAEFPFGVAHCNFQLRGAASDGDEVFVEKMAAAWGVPFFAKRFETKTYAKKNGLSIQMAARELRYEWFREIAASNGFARIATAHNLNDSVETALLNFVRGTGLAGLKGIAVTPGLSPERRGVPLTELSTSPLLSGEGPGAGLIRPLLFATRADIERHAQTLQLAWREDLSNASDDYARNFLRHRVVPFLEELNPNFLRTAERNLARLRETGENLDFLLQNFLREKPPAENEFSIEKQKLAQLPAPRRALRELLKTYGFSEEQIRQLAENLDRVGLELYSNSGWRLLNDREKILLVPNSKLQTPNSELPARPARPGRQTIEEDDVMVTLPDGFRLFLTPADPSLPFPDGQEAIVADAEKLRFPLLLRPWQAGDVFQPFGMNGHSQKLQDFFTNLKLSRLEKEKIRVLENSDGIIIWVIGHRLDERFRVTPETNKFLKISYL